MTMAATFFSGFEKKIKGKERSRDFRILTYCSFEPPSSPYSSEFRVLSLSTYSSVSAKESSFSRSLSLLMLATGVALINRCSLRYSIANEIQVPGRLIGKWALTFNSVTSGVSA